QLATERQKVWPLPATTGDNWQQPRQHLARRHLATIKNGVRRHLARDTQNRVF
ncbi:hypothetical protein A2U01_0099727, partial [Trifolium medium]|nr:hypothetical protein [Trifolium medium]